MHTRLVPIVLVFVFVAFAHAQPQGKFEINTALMESTFMIEGPGARGTVFFLGMPSKKDSTRAYYVMITAAHVLDAIRGEQATLNLRTKSADGHIKKLPVSIQIRENGKPLWTHHPDPSVDVAAKLVPLPNKAYMPSLISTDLLATDAILAQFEIHPGDQLICLGYPFGYEANDAGYPVLRSGRIASYPLVPTNDVKTFLFDFTVFPGNSGGPVYFCESNRVFGGATQIGTVQFVAGLVIEETQMTEKTQSLYETREQRYPLRLATAIHASLIVQTIAKLPPIQ
jgi:hypothetical protein